MKNPFTKYEPPEDTEPSFIYDIYGNSIIVHFPVGDKVSPHNCEIGICSAQLGMGVEDYKAMIREHQSSMTS